jgi:dTDP-glucose 4,6-dehydratase
MEPHLRAPDPAHQLFEQLWTASIPGKAHTVDDYQGARWRGNAVYGRGLNVRDWLFVEDHAQALTLILEQGKVGETYNLGGNAERRNIEVVNAICDAMDELKPCPNGMSYRELIAFVSDRPGHDFRYAIDFAKLKTELGWSPKHSFETGLHVTVKWYLENRVWWEPLLSAHDASARRGLSKKSA